MTDEWGPWIEHDGRGCPAVGMWVNVETFSAGSTEAFVYSPGSSWFWYTDGGKIRTIDPDANPIIRYRVRRPKALQKLIQMVENLPAPSKQYEDA